MTKKTFLPPTLETQCSLNNFTPSDNLIFSPQKFIIAIVERTHRPITCFLDTAWHKSMINSEIRHRHRSLRVLWIQVGHYAFIFPSLYVSETHWVSTETQTRNFCILNKIIIYKAKIIPLANLIIDILR